MALTTLQILDFQADLNIGNDESIFTNVELDRLYTRAGDDFNLAVYYGWRQILAGSAAWVDYQVAQTKVSRSQAFDHIKAMVAFWAGESMSAANEVRFLGMRPVPTLHKPVPADEFDGRRWPYPWSRYR